VRITKKRFNYNEAAAAKFYQTDAKNQAALAAKAREEAERAAQSQREQLASAERASAERKIAKDANAAVSKAQVFARIKPSSFANDRTTAADSAIRASSERIPERRVESGADFQVDSHR